MSELSDIPPVAHQISLVLHTAVDYGKYEGIGIGAVRSAATGAARASTLPMEEHKHGIERGQVRTKNVKTRERAHIYALILAMGLARSTLKRQCTTARIKVLSVTVLCSLPAVVGLIKYHCAHSTQSLRFMVSAEDCLMMKRALASVEQLSRYNVQVSIVEDRAEGNTVDAARVKIIARQRRKKAYCRRRQARRTMSKNAGTAGDEEEDGGSDEEADGADGGEERNNSLHSGPMTERESSSIFMMDEKGEPELHWTRRRTPHSSAAALKQPTDTKRAKSGSPISRSPESPNLQALPFILVHRTKADSDLLHDAETMQNA